MSKVLFLTQPSVGHLNTLLTIALQMRDDGHDVHFLVPGPPGKRRPFPAGESQRQGTSASVLHIIRGHDLPLETVRPSLAALPWAVLLPFKTGYDELVCATKLFSKGTAYYARKVVPTIERLRPEVLVSDFGFPAAHLAGELTGVPCVVVYHSGLPVSGSASAPSSITSSACASAFASHGSIHCWGT